MTEQTKHTGKYLTFNLGSEEYAITITKVKEIIGRMKITEVPQHESYMKGVINLRDKVIPIIDSRLRFKMEPQDYTDRTCIIIFEIDRGEKIISAGLVVDSVSEVLMITDEQVDNSKDLGLMMSHGYISGMAKVNGGIKILLDIDAVFDNTKQEDAEHLDRAA
jgi:purine-binding chemotaxis protein CheW